MTDMVAKFAVRRLPGSYNSQTETRQLNFPMGGNAGSPSVATFDRSITLRPPTPVKRRISESIDWPIMLSKSLASALPDSVIFPHDAAAFKRSINSYWAQQECEAIPACVVRPRNVQQLCTAVTVLKRQYDERGQ